MALWIGWARVLVAGDYLSTIEIPTLDAESTIDGYLATLERLRPLVEASVYVVPGHGPITDAVRALRVLEEDVSYLGALRRDGVEAALPPARRGVAQRALHAENVTSLERSRWLWWRTRQRHGGLCGG
jgi:glyoxylase-like metal-dependent hydrolase (beta-lactamase superfamily II)